MGRDHRSNSVHWVAHLADGQAAQKCHDPDCAGYRGEWVQMPRELCLAAAAADVQS